MAEPLPAFGRAAVITAYDAPLEVREFPVTPPQPRELLVRIERATVCGSDVHAWRGALAAAHDIELPIVPGHEAVGRVVAMGEGAELDSVGTPLKPGDRVVWAHEACGQCYYCSVERIGALCSNRRIGFLKPAESVPHFNGTFAEYAYVWGRSGRLRVPDGVDSATASAASCALRTVVNAWHRLGGVDYRHTVLILGSGPLGLFATALAASVSPARLVVVGGPVDRLEVASAWGADVTLDVAEHPDVEDRVARVMDATDGRGADVICEFSGAPGAFADGLRFAALNARYVVSGTVTGGDQPVPVQAITRKNISIQGSLSADIDSYYRGLQFLEQQRHRFDWSLMSGSVFSLSEATQALEVMTRLGEIKPSIDPSRH
jgi:L-iditol 2-dehydrogenase